MIHSERLQEHLVLTFSNVDSLVSDTFFSSFVSQIENVLGDMDQGKITKVSLVMEGRYSDYNEFARNHFQTKLSFSNLAERIAYFRLFVRFMQQSPIIWRFFCADNCLGLMWEIALACHERYWTTAEAYVGFSEIRENIFPPLGVYEALVKDLKITKDRLQTHFKRTTLEMQQQGFLKLLPTNSDWIQYPKLISGKIPTDPRKKSEFSGWGSLAGKFQQIKKLLLQQRENEIDDALKTERHHAVSLFEYFDKLKGKGRIEEEKVILNFCTQIFSRKYLNWLFRRSSHLEYETNPKATDGKFLLYIDLEEIIPPTPCIKALLNARYSIVFFHEEADILRKSLEIIFSRLESEMGLDAVQEAFTNQIDWMVAHPRKETSVIAKWGLGGPFALFVFGEKIFYFRTSGNHAGARLGWCERYQHVSEKALKYVSTLEGTLAYGIIPVEYDGANIHVHQIRSLLWSELLYCCFYLTKTSPPKMIQLLKKFGWDFAGDENGWNQFLKNRFEFEGDFKKLKHFIRERVFEKSMHSITIDEFANFFKIRDGDLKYSEAMVHYHLLCYCAVLSRYILAKKWVENAMKADVLVSQATGFPRSYGTPSLFIDEASVPSALYYLGHSGLDLKGEFEGMHAETH